VYDRAKKILAGSPVTNRVWGVGFHWYSGDHFEGLRLVHERLNKAAENYAKEICEDFNNYTAAFCDWNILLKRHGGSHNNRTNTSASDYRKEDKSAGCYAPVLYDDEKKELIYTPIYYYIAHFAKFIKPGAVKIATTKYTDRLHTCAFKNADGQIVLIVLNATTDRLPVNIRHNDCIKKYL
jgi:glucosylceramidase